MDCTEYLDNQNLVSRLNGGLAGFCIEKLSIPDSYRRSGTGNSSHKTHQSCEYPPSQLQSTTKPLSKCDFDFTRSNPI